jgi:predicted transcriptional regulator
MRLSTEQRESIIQEIRLAMKSAGHVQSDVTAFTGVDQGQVSRILSGQFRYRSDTVNKICEYADNILKKEQASPLMMRQKLIDAVIDAWDGTEGGGREIIRFLSVVKMMTSRFKRSS